MIKLKTEKIKAYYIAEEILTDIKPPITAKVKQYIHSEKSQGLWSAVRDLSLTETLNAAQANIAITLQFTINYNESVIDKWNDLLLEFRGTTYKIEGKPDQLDYQYMDMVIRATAVVDPEVITEVRYDV